MPNETVWGMPKKTVALYSGGVYLHFRSVCNLVDIVRRRIDTGSQSMVDSSCVSYSWGHFIQLYGFMYESALCWWPACQIGCYFQYFQNWLPACKVKSVRLT